jgi:4-amino-4-deoxy-L-arabinose transferase-like glycosyltransferase
MVSRVDPNEMVTSYGDAITYVQSAKNLISEHAFLNGRGKPEVSRTPGYPIFLAAIMLMVGQDPAKILITQAFLLSFQVLLLYGLARRVLPPVTAFIGGVLAAFSPWGAVHAGLAMSEGLFLFLLTLIFFIMKLTTEANNQIAVAVGGACTGLLTAAAVLVRPIWPLVLIIDATFLLLYGAKRKGVWLLLLTTLVFAVIPLLIWKTRNQRVAQFDGLSDITGKTAWHYLASRVVAHINNQDRWAVRDQADLEESTWKTSVQQADDERWQRAKTVFRQHPMLTAYYFLLSSTEHAIHPSPDVLLPAKLNFDGDYWVLALLWGGLLILACLGWQHSAGIDFENVATDRTWLSALLVVCVLLTLSSGVSFGAGSRLRVPLEVIVPLLAAVGLSHMIFPRPTAIPLGLPRRAHVPNKG